MTPLVTRLTRASVRTSDVSSSVQCRGRSACPACGVQFFKASDLQMPCRAVTGTQPVSPLLQAQLPRHDALAHYRLPT